MSGVVQFPSGEDAALLAAIARGRKEIALANGLCREGALLNEERRKQALHDELATFGDVLGRTPATLSGLVSYLRYLQDWCDSNSDSAFMNDWPQLCGAGATLFGRIADTVERAIKQELPPSA